MKKCPKCGSENLIERKPKDGRKRFTCTNCGYRMIEKGQTNNDLPEHDQENELEYNPESEDMDDRLPIDSLIETPDDEDDEDDEDENPETPMESTREKCLGLAKAWHISAVLSAIALIVGGIAMASITENGLMFLYYLIAAFFAYLINETISAVINWLVSRK